MVSAAWINPITDLHCRMKLMGNIKNFFCLLHEVSKFWWALCAKILFWEVWWTAVRGPVTTRFIIWIFPPSAFVLINVINQFMHCCCFCPKPSWFQAFVSNIEITLDLHLVVTTSLHCKYKHHLLCNYTHVPRLQLLPRQIPTFGGDTRPDDVPSSHSPETTMIKSSCCHI